jgi:hypothetical protein
VGERDERREEKRREGIKRLMRILGGTGVVDKRTMSSIITTTQR